MLAYQTEMEEDETEEDEDEEDQNNHPVSIKVPTAEEILSSSLVSQITKCRR